MHIFFEFIEAHIWHIYITFSFFQVNGTDVSGFPHKDAVRVFLTAEEPIVVEVKRRITDALTIDSRSSPLGRISTAVQTDIGGFTWFEEDCLAQSVDLEVRFLYLLIHVQQETL